jgi:arylformamidase
MANRRQVCGMIGGAALFGGLFDPRSLVAAGDSPSVRDENLPDTSSYETFRHPEAEDLDYIHDLYGKADRMTADARKALPHYLNLPYGEHRKQRLDLYLPQGSIRDAPVLIFAHGGGFEEGHRAHYGYIALPYASKGIITAVMGYRLVTDGVVYPAQVDDTEDAIAWIHKSIRRYGGNPDALFISGHSAGALLSAEVGADRTWMPGKGMRASALKGMAAVSGRYVLADDSPEDPDGQSMAAFYAPSRELQDRASPLKHISDPTPAAVVARGEGQQYERLLTRSSAEFVRALRDKGVDAKFIEVPSATHIDMVFAFATPGSPIFEAVVAMIQRHAG